MINQQTFIKFLFLLLVSQQIMAVINKSQNTTVEENSMKKQNSEKDNKESNSNSESSSIKLSDSVAANTEQDANRRESPPSETYGVPNIGNGQDSYISSGPLINPTLPIPVYGVPDAPSNNIVYPAPPPDIPPPLPSPAFSYGPSKPPNNNFILPGPTFGSFPSGIGSIPSKYGPPPIQSRPSKPFISQSFNSKPHNIYGPPRPQFGHSPKPNFIKYPKPTYGPPKMYGPPHKVHYPTKPFFIPQKQISRPVINNIGPIPPPPIHNTNQLSFNYGPPEPVSHHGPPRPGIPAPPTPPDIKYDGWQPIPGLVSRPKPSDSYGVPNGQHHGNGDLQFNTDFSPPPISSGSHSLSSSHSSQSSVNGVSDSYGAPLNTVTGSGGIVSSSGDSHGSGEDHSSLSAELSTIGLDHSSQNQLSIIKSMGYELFPNSGSVSGSYLPPSTYGAPPSSSYSQNGPYAAAHSYKSHGFSSASFDSFNSNNFHSPHSSGIGLIPPSGIYGIPPNGQYGTPLLSTPSYQHGAPLNALKINPPKRPILFREPVPPGLIESVGKHTAQKDAHGIIDSPYSNNFNSGPTYIPPPIPDVSKLSVVKKPSTLYSLPNLGSATSFQSFPTSFVGFGGSHSLLNSYNAPLSSIDGFYGLPTQPLSVSLDHSHPPATIDLSHFNSASSGFGYQNNQNDCSGIHGSQPLPSLNYDVPSNSHTSLSSLTTIIEGAHKPAPIYGVPDLHTAHSQTVQTEAINAIESESQGKSYGKSLVESFGSDSELIKSDSIDFNNIPVQGSLGSYTLQIQSADGLGGNGESGQVPHAQVLNDGLLQSILAAIEQPQQKNSNSPNQQIYQLQSSNFDSQITPTADEQPIHDSEPQNSATSTVVVSPPPITVSSTAKTIQRQESVSDTSLHLIDNNEIALYFSNKSEKSTSANGKFNNTSEVSTLRNGQQYGSFDTFKTPSSSYKYEYAEASKQKN